MHPFDNCLGIEMLDNLFQQSLLMKQEYEKTQNKPKFEVYGGDMLDDKDLDWSNADLVLANSTCFDQDLM